MLEFTLNFIAILIGTEKSRDRKGSEPKSLGTEKSRDRNVSGPKWPGPKWAGPKRRDRNGRTETAGPKRPVPENC